MPITTRRATEADAGLVSALNVDVQRLHSTAVPWRFKPPGPETFPPAEAARLLAKPDHHVFIAEDGGEAVGYVYVEVVRRPEGPYHFAHDLIYVHHISVRPQSRRRGAGDALMAAVRGLGEEAGIDLISLTVWSFNDGAQAFFARHGLKPYMMSLWTR